MDYFLSFLSTLTFLGICDILLSFLILYYLLLFRKSYKNIINPILFYFFNFSLIFFGAYCFGSGLYSVLNFSNINVLGLLTYILLVTPTIIKKDLKSYLKK